MHSNRSIMLGFALATLVCLFPVNSQAGSKRSLSNIQQLSIGGYNMENFFEKNGQIHKESTLDFLLNQITPDFGTGTPPLKSVATLKDHAQAILDNDYDVLVLEEIEDITVLTKFNTEFLGGIYDSYLIEGNDPRGIDVGFYVKKDLPLYVEERTHKFETWNDPTKNGATVKLFSRDVPALLLRAEENSAPVFVYMGTHFKSKLERPEDPQSNGLRQAQVERTCTLVNAYEQEFGKDTPLFLAGDFNGDINDEKEFVSFGQQTDLKDSFNLVSPPLSDRDRTTHVYIPKGGHVTWSQLDSVMANSAAASLITGAEVYRYKDADGTPRPVPTNWAQLRKNPSDHFPTHVTVDFQRMLSSH